MVLQNMENGVLFHFILFYFIFSYFPEQPITKEMLQM